MKDVNKAFELKNKCIKIVSDRGVFSSVDWLINQKGIGLSEDIKVLNDQTEENFDNCQRYYSFEFNGNRYELFLENGHYFDTPDDRPFWGDARLLFNDKLVFLTNYEKQISDWGESTYELITINNTIETLCLGDWVNDLPILIDIEKNSLRKIEEKKKNEDKSEQAKEIEKNFYLGQFEELNTVEVEVPSVDNITLEENALRHEKHLPDPSEIDLYDESGYTPLMRAAKEGDFELVLALIEEGANPKIEDENFGTSTALNMAQLLFVRTGRKEYQKIIDLLKPIT